MQKKFPREQIVGILRQFEGTEKTIKEYYREKNSSEGTFYKWRSRFGTMEVAAGKARLKHLFAERDLEIDLRRQRSKSFQKRPTSIRFGRLMHVFDQSLSGRSLEL